MTARTANSMLSRALSFGTGVKQAVTLGKQTNSVLYATIGIAIGAAVPTGLVLAFGAAFSAFIPLGSLALGAAGLLYGRRQADMDPPEQTASIEGILKLKYKEMQYLDHRLSVPNLSATEQEATVAQKNFLLRSDIAALRQHYSLKGDQQRLPPPNN